MRISIDAERCEGHGRCWETAPELVVDDERGHGVVRAPGQDLPAELEQSARRAASACPEQAVTISG